MTESLRSANVMLYYYSCCTTLKLWWQYLLFSWITVRVSEVNYVNELEYQFKCIPMCRFFKRRWNCRYTTWFRFSILSVWLRNTQCVSLALSIAVTWTQQRPLPSEVFPFSAFQILYLVHGNARNKWIIHLRKKKPFEWKYHNA